MRRKSLPPPPIGLHCMLPLWLSFPAKILPRKQMCNNKLRGRGARHHVHVHLVCTCTFSTYMCGSWPEDRAGYGVLQCPITDEGYRMIDRLGEFVRLRKLLYKRAVPLVYIICSMLLREKTGPTSVGCCAAC